MNMEIMQESGIESLNKFSALEKQAEDLLIGIKEL
jgi:hypothetical protein